MPLPSEPKPEPVVPKPEPPFGFEPVFEPFPLFPPVAPLFPVLPPVLPLFPPVLPLPPPGFVGSAGVMKVVAVL